VGGGAQDAPLVGIVRGDGGAPLLPLLSLLRVNPAVVDDKNTRRTFSSRAKAWAEEARRGASVGGVTFLSNGFAGFGVGVYPFHVDGELVGALFVTGFLRESTETRDLISMRQEVTATGQESDVSQDDYDAIRRVSQRDELALGHLAGALGAAMRERLMHQLEDHGRAQASGSASEYYGMIGSSRPMKRLFALIDRAARSSSTVLVLGENGTGKELVARALHRRSARRDRPFIVQNCAAIPAELIESELFGHKKGAFSGAHRDREGLFETANHGTFFLDEIGEMDLTLQAKLLRVLQEGTFMPVGGSTYRKVDVRMVCATNRDLAAMVRSGAFREDLYYRINVITLSTPPLRAREYDLDVLIEHFLGKSAHRHNRPLKRLAPECMEVLRRYRWPGNVRELENEIERMVILSGEDEEIQASLVSPRISGAKPEEHAGFVSTQEMTMPEAVERLERAMILGELQRNGWNKTQAARALGVSRRNLIRKVAHYELEEEPEFT